MSHLSVGTQRVFQRNQEYGVGPEGEGRPVTLSAELASPAGDPSGLFAPAWFVDQLGQATGGEALAGSADGGVKALCKQVWRG